MSLKKTVAIVAAASALAAISVPAMAFENEVHGTYTFRYYLTNYEQAGPGNLTGALPAGNTTNNLKMNNYFEQRARVFYTAKASDDLKLVTAFEIDSDFGDKAQGSIPATGGLANSGVGTAFRNSGGALEADAVNLETKWVYLDFAIPSTPVRVKAGIQPFKDQIKGIFGDFDAAGVMTSSKIGALTLNAGYMRLYDESFLLLAGGNNARVKGLDNLDVGVLEAQFAVTKDTKLGFAYYLLNDGRSTSLSANTVTAGADATPPVAVTGTTADVTRRGTSNIHVVALNGETKVGPLTLSGFGAYEFGELNNVVNPNNTNATLSAFAFNAAAKAAVGPGTFRTAFLYTSGNDNDASNGRSAHSTGWVGVTQSPNTALNATLPVNSYNEGGMLLLNRNTADKITNTDVTMVSTSGNGNGGALTSQGLWLATVGFDATITPKAYLNTNIGLAWAAHTNNQKPTDLGVGGVGAATHPQNATNYMGAEANIEAGYKMYDNLTAKLQAAYVVLGGYYKNGLNINGTVQTPENPYTARMMLSYAF